MNYQRKLSRREKLWNRDPHCFWCGRETRLCENGGVNRKLPDDAATVDHIRSRLSPNRKQPNDRPGWHTGITVLACYRCNNVRGRHEIAFFREIDQQGFEARGNGKTSRPTLTQCQSRLCNAILDFLRSGGLLIGDESRTRGLRQLAENLQTEYDAANNKAVAGIVNH